MGANDSEPGSLVDRVTKAMEIADRFPGYSELNGDKYPGIIRINLAFRKAVLSYLRIHEQEYGRLHPSELRSHVGHSGSSLILIEPTRDQAVALATAVDMVNSTGADNSPLRYIKDISPDTCIGHLQ